MKSPEDHSESVPRSNKKHVREMVFLAEQAKEGALKVLPGKAWAQHFPVPAEERREILQGVLDGKVKPQDAESKVTPDALVYDAADLDREGLDGVSSRIFDESATVQYYDYPRFTKFVSEMKGTKISVGDCEKLYGAITKARTQKKLRDAFGTTGQGQLDGVLVRDAKAIVRTIDTLPPTEKVLQALKLDWLCRDRGAIGTLERDEVVSKLSGSERELFKKLSTGYRQYVDQGDEAGYKELLEGIRDNHSLVEEKKEASDAPSDSMQKLEEEIEEYKKDTGNPGTPNDPAIPPEDADEYHTPEGGSPEQPEQSGPSQEQQEQRPIFEIEPPLGGYYAGGRKSYYDRTRKTWSKKKQLSEYAGVLSASGRHTLSGKTDRGVKSLAIPNSYALDAVSVKYTGSKPRLHRDQNGCFYIETDGPSTFSVEFAKEDKLFTGPVVAEDTEKLYAGALSTESETLLQALQGNAMNKAEQVRQHILANHFYPGGGDLGAAQAVQAKLRHESTPDAYIQNIDKAEYLECYSSNTLFVAMIRQAGIPARLVIGHKVEGARDGKSAITESTGHAWSEVWDGGKWVRFDATPAPKPEDKKKDNKEKEDDAEKESAPEAKDNGKEAPQKEQEKGGTPSDEENGESKEQGEASDSDVQEGENSVQQSKEKLEKDAAEKEKLEKKLESENSFEDLEKIKEEIQQADLLDDMQKELDEKVEAKEEQMKESIKDELDKMVKDGFLDEEKRNELEQKLLEEDAAELDRLREQLEQENSLYNEYENIRDEVMPLVDKWFEFFVERLPREQNVDVDEDSLTRQGVFNRRSVNKARNLLFGSIKNPRIIKSSVKPLFMSSILVDVSGSMAGEKLQNARKLLVFYSELFTKISEEFGYIRFSINTFSDRVNEIKAFDQDYSATQSYLFPDNSRSTVKFRLMNNVTALGGTNMLDSVKKAAADLNRETHDFPDYASAFYFVGDGEDTCGNSGNVSSFLQTNDAERGFGDHMRSAIMLGTESQKAILANIFGEEHTTVAPDLDSLIEESMLRFNDDIEAYMNMKTG